MDWYFLKTASLKNYFKMKKILLLHLLLLITISVFAQSNKEAKIAHIFGANTLYLTRIGESETPPINIISPYLLDYRVQKGTVGARLGLGGRLNRTLIKDEGFADSETIVDYRTDIRGGVFVAKTFDEKGKFGISYGLDVFLSSSNDVLIQDSSFDRVTFSEKIVAYGGGLTFALRYEVIKNLIIHSELSMYGRYAEQKNEVDFENFPNANDESQITIGTDIWMISPVNLFVSYRF